MEYFTLTRFCMKNINRNFSFFEYLDIFPRLSNCIFLALSITKIMVQNVFCLVMMTLLNQLFVLFKKCLSHCLFIYFVQKILAQNLKLQSDDDCAFSDMIAEFLVIWSEKFMQQRGLKLNCAMVLTIGPKSKSLRWGTLMACLIFKLNSEICKDILFHYSTKEGNKQKISEY